MDSFDCDILIPEELQDYRIIKFVLQPLVENAIFHGVEPADHFCKIVISAAAEDGVLNLVVEDNGVGMDQRRLAVLNGQVEAAEGRHRRGQRPQPDQAGIRRKIWPFL